MLRFGDSVETIVDRAPDRDAVAIHVVINGPHLFRIRKHFDLDDDGVAQVLKDFVKLMGTEV